MKTFGLLVIALLSLTLVCCEIRSHQQLNHWSDTLLLDRDCTISFDDK